MPIENALGFLRSLEGSRPLAGTIVVFGPHGFLREFVVSTTAARLATKGYKYRSIQIGAGGDLAAALDELGEPDLFAARRLVVCRVLKSHRDRGGDDLAGDDEDSVPSRAAPGGGEAALAEVIEAGVAPNHLMLVYERDNLPTRIRKAAERSSALVNCLRPFDNQIPDYALAFARARGRRLGAGSADFLAARHAGDLPAIANALDKAALLAEDGKTIEESALSEPGTRKIPDLFEIADGVARGLASRVLGQVDRALAFGRDPIELLAVEIIPALRRMMIAATLLSHRRGGAEIASAIGAAPNSGLVTRAIDGARRFGLERLKKSYTRAIELDESFKNGTIKEREQALGVLLLDLMA
jgi:DNA polymerase III delta subunit